MWVSRAAHLLHLQAFVAVLNLAGKELPREDEEKIDDMLALARTNLNNKVAASGLPPDEISCRRAVWPMAGEGPVPPKLTHGVPKY